MQLVPLLTNKDISLKVTVRLCSSCVRSSMLHGSETWPIRKESEVALQQAEMRMIRWMCRIKLQDRVPSKGLSGTLICHISHTGLAVRWAFCFSVSFQIVR